MQIKLIYLIISIIIIILAIAVWQYVLAVYEVRFEVNPNQLYADNESELIIEAVPINSLGFRAPFRYAEINYNFEFGNNLVEVEEYLEEGKLKVKAKDRDGIVSIFIKSTYSLMPTKIEIIINSNFT